jgi:hypothetical protein
MPKLNGYEAARFQEGRSAMRITERGILVYPRLQPEERGDIELPLDPDRKLYLFPDTPETLAKLKKLKAGRVQRVRL